MFQDFRYPDTTHLSRSVDVLKLKNFKKDATLKLSKISNQEWYEHVGPEVASPQDGKVTRWRRDCAWLMISRCSRSQCQIQVQGTSSIQKSMITTTYSQEKGEAKTTSTPTSPTSQAQVTYVSESVSYSKFEAKTFKVNEELRKGCWWEIVRRRPTAASKDHMMFSSFRFNTTAGNPVKKILLKLNLSDHRKLKKGSKDFRYSDTTRFSRSVEVLKLKNFKKDATLKLSKSIKLRMMLKITMLNTSSRNKLNPEVNDHYNIFSRESKEYELKTKDEA
ncbi:hypothetical protein Tco_0767506 [Tanacetum coccineum]